MTPWHRYWFPSQQSDSDPGASAPPAWRDASLWSPHAIAETQRELWQHAAQATQQWWAYWCGFWPSLPPAQPPAGVVVPPPETGDAAPADTPAPRGARKARG